MPNKVLTIRIKNFKKWQRNSQNPTFWTAVSKSFFSDHKIREARRHHADAPEVYLWLLLNANYEDEGIKEISESSLKENLMIDLGVKSNRFDIWERLNALVKAGLIQIETHLETPLKQIKEVSNRVLNGGLNESQTGLETPQTQSQPDPITIQDNTNLTSSSQDPGEEEKNSDPMELAIQKAESSFVRHQNKNLKAQDKQQFFTSIRPMCEEVKQSNPNLRPYDISDAWSKTLEAALKSKDGVKSCKWYKTTFYDKLGLCRPP